MTERLELSILASLRSIYLKLPNGRVTDGQELWRHLRQSTERPAGAGHVFARGAYAAAGSTPRW